MHVSCTPQYYVTLCTYVVLISHLDFMCFYNCVSIFSVVQRELLVIWCEEVCMSVCTCVHVLCQSVHVCMSCVNLYMCACSASVCTCVHVLCLSVHVCMFCICLYMYACSLSVHMYLVYSCHVTVNYGCTFSFLHCSIKDHQRRTCYVSFIGLCLVLSCQ